MSVTPKDNDGFFRVSYKGKRKKRLKQNINSLFNVKDVPHPLCNFKLVITNVLEELQCSNFITHFKEDLLNVLNEWDLGYLLTSKDSNYEFSDGIDDFISTKQTEANIDILCYGLGQFSTCTIARYQLGFLLILKELLHSVHVYIYDPQFSDEERDFLTELGLNVLQVNEEAKRTLEGKTVCFLPHCDLPLYNNLLWANWDVQRLSGLVIIGNSFQSYSLNDARGCLKERAKYVYLADKFTTEIRMANLFRFSDIFNDLSIHYFVASSLESVHSMVWTDLEEPEYSDGDDIIKSTVVSGVSVILK